jgi:hypothetical protein
MFLSLGNYLDSSNRADECKSMIIYGEAIAAYNEEEYVTAKELFLSLGNFLDCSNRAKECDEKIYGQAVAAYNEGKFYTAQKLFLGLVDYLDSSSRANECIQEWPSPEENGVLYKNSELEFGYYKVVFSLLNFKKTNIYIKIYSTDYVLVATLFIPADKVVKEHSFTETKMPHGKFIVRYAYGDSWYGTTEMFGDEGIYRQWDGQLDFETSRYGTEGWHLILLGDGSHSFEVDRDGF